MNKKILSIASAGIAFVAVTGAVFAADTAPTTSTSDLATKQAHHPQHGHFNHQELPSFLKIDLATLQQEFKAGKSLAEIASVQGKTEQDVIDFLVKQETKRIDQWAASGKLTQDKADQMKSKLADRIKTRVEHKGLFDGKPGGKFKGKGTHRGPRKPFKEIASIIGVDQQEMMTKIKAGESIAQIAKAHNINEQDLIDKLLEKDKERITKMVEKTWQKHGHSSSNNGN